MEILNIDSKLQNIIKNEYPRSQFIFEKLERNNNNLNILSSTELDKLWSCIKNLLQDIKKLPAHEEFHLASDTYSTFIKFTQQLLKLDHIPDILPDVFTLLNSRIPEIKDITVKDELSSFLEECWSLKLIKDEKKVTNVLKHLAECSRCSREHVVRLNDIKYAIHSLISVKDIQNVMKLARESTLLQIPGGRELLIYLLTIEDHWTMGVYNNMRVSLETADINCVKTYAEIFMNAWRRTTAHMKIIETCLENLVYHCLGAQRDIKGRQKLGQNLLTFLESFHLQKKNDIKRMICDKYYQFIWSYLEAPGSCVRCNTAEVLFLAYPMNVSNKILKINSRLKTKNKNLTKQHNAITNLLRDSNQHVCSIALKEGNIPPKVVNEWLNLALECTKTSNDPEMRKSVFEGLKYLLKNPQSHSDLEKVVPKFVHSMHDTNVDVKLSVLGFFLELENSTKIHVWNVIPLKFIIECLEMNSQTEVVDLLHKLLWARISFQKEEERIINEIINAGQININVFRTFLLHSRDIICYENALELLNVLLPAITQIIELLPEKEFNENMSLAEHEPSAKRRKSCAKQSRFSRRLDVNELSSIEILMDASALLYLVNIESFIKNSFKNCIKELNVKIVEKLRHILEKCENSELSETVIFFLSLIPKKSIKNFEGYLEKYKRKLFHQSVSDNTILSILNLLIKWDEIDSLLELLPSLLTVDENLQHKLVSFVQIQPINYESTVERQTRMLNFGLRIIQIIFQNNFQYTLIPKYHKNVVQLWENLHFIEACIGNRLINNDLSGVFSDDVLKTIFKHYISLIPILHHSDDFRSEIHFSRIVMWNQENIVLQISGLTDLETDELSINILSCVLNTSNDMIVQLKAPPKLCCEIIILYTKCLIEKCGIVFINSALVTLLSLMKFSTDMFNNDESEILKVIAPSLFVSVMITLAKYPEELVKKYTSNFKSLANLIKNIFPLLGQSLDLRLRYMTIVFNTAVFCLSKDFKTLLENEQCFSGDVLNRDFPFITEEIIKIILYGEGFQDLCIDVLNMTYSKFSQIHQLSSLMIIQRLIKQRNKSTIKKRNRIKNIICLIKEQNQKSTEQISLTSVRDKFISDSKRMIIEDLLNLQIP